MTTANYPPKPDDTFTLSASESGDSTHAPLNNKATRLKNRTAHGRRSRARFDARALNRVGAVLRLRIRFCPRRRAEGAVYGAGVGRRRATRRRRKEMEIDREHDTHQRTDSNRTTFCDLSRHGCHGCVTPPAVTAKPGVGVFLPGILGGVTGVTGDSRTIARKRACTHTRYAPDRLLYSRDTRDTSVSPRVFGRQRRQQSGLGVTPPAVTPRDARRGSRDTPVVSRGGLHV